MSGLKREAPPSDSKPVKKVKAERPHGKVNGDKSNPTRPQKPKVEDLYNAKSSREAHAKQKSVAKERKLAKPNADSIQRAKKLWEKLRLKSHVPKEERQTLVAELFSIISGRVKEFVFKHDSVRTVQCALKYASRDQRKAIALELKGEYKNLAESRYAKFLVGKILVDGDKDIREMVISEFYGHVRRLINHPEASWILDDTYRQIATKKQKAILLREWYGQEFSIFKSEKDVEPSADLLKLLDASPERRRPVLQHLHSLINQLIQKKLTGFTMLHDAMLQYSLAISTPPSNDAAAIAATASGSAHVEWLDLLKPTEEEDLDLMKNLAFTASGCRVVARALALSPSAKDRKLLLRAYKDHGETLACDANGSCVILATYECVDDTVMVSKLFSPDLLASKTVDMDARADAVATLGTHPVGRVPLLWPLINNDTKLPGWLVRPGSQAGDIVDEVRALRAGTSKKQASTRRGELAKAQLTTADGAMLAAIEKRAETLVGETVGCQFIMETLLAAERAHVTSHAAMEAVARLAEGDPTEEGHVARSAPACRMLKTLVQRGRFDTQSSTLVKIDGPPDGLHAFPALLWAATSEHLEQWATGDGSFVMVALCEDTDFDAHTEVLARLKGMKDAIKAAATAAPSDAKDKKDAGKKAADAGNKGSRLLLEKL